MSTAEWIASQVGHVDIEPGVAVAMRSPRPPKKVKVRDVVARPAQQKVEEESVVATSSPETKQEVPMSTATTQYADPTNPMAYLGTPGYQPPPPDVPLGVPRAIAPGATIVVDFTRPGGEAATIEEKFNQRDLAAARTHDNFVQTNLAKLYGPGTYTLYQVGADGKKKPLGLVAIAPKMPGIETPREPKGAESGVLKDYLDAVKQISLNEQARAREEAARREREVEKSESLLSEVFKSMIARPSSGSGMEAVMPLLVMNAFSQNRPQVQQALSGPTSTEVIDRLAAKIDQYLAPQPTYPEPQPQYPQPQFPEQESPVATLGQTVGTIVELMKTLSPQQAPQSDPLAGVRLGIELATAREPKEVKPAFDIKEIIVTAAPVLATLGSVLTAGVGLAKGYLDSQKAEAAEARRVAEESKKELQAAVAEMKDAQFKELERRISERKTPLEEWRETQNALKMYVEETGGGGGGGSSMKEWTELISNFMRARSAAAAPPQIAAPPPPPTIVVLRDSETLPDGTQTMRQFGQLVMTHPGGTLPDGQIAPPQYAVYPLVTSPMALPPGGPAAPRPQPAPQGPQGAPQGRPDVPVLPTSPEFLMALQQLSMTTSETEILQGVAAALSLISKNPAWAQHLTKLLHALKEGRKMDAAGEVRGLFNYFALNGWMPEAAARRATEAVLANYDTVAQFAQAGMLDVN